MKYTVVWSEEAEARLAEIWLAASDRSKITDSSQRIDAMLELDAEQVGESRMGDRRIVLEPPLGAAFSVDEINRTVLVLGIWLF